MESIPVLYSFARSGGTLVNQLLGVHPQCAVLSEVNPAASCKPVAEQASEWLGLVSAEDATELARMAYARQIRALQERAREKSKHLVVRDWVTVNFLPGTAGDIVSPSGELEQALYLAHEGLEPLPLVVTRRAEGVLRSIRRTFPHLATVDDDTFAQCYLEFAKAVAPLPRVKLEDLRTTPDAVLETILDAFQLDASNRSSLLERFHEYRNCTGNTSLASSNESSSAKTVLPPEDAPGGAVPPALLEADRIFGYA